MNKNKRECDLTKQELVQLVRQSQEGYIIPGRKLLGQRMLHKDAHATSPKHDVLYHWRQLFIRCVDEYDFAISAFGDYNLYIRFKNSSSFYRNMYLPLWLEEQELVNRSKALKCVVNDIKEGSVKSAQWLEKHIATLTKEPKSKKKERLDTVLEDAVSMSIEQTWSNIQ